MADQGTALKERLTGAAILVVIVVLVVPSLLTGRRTVEPEADASGASKTYEIDLAGSARPVREDPAHPPVEPKPVARPSPTVISPAPAPAEAAAVREAPTGVPPVPVPAGPASTGGPDAAAKPSQQNAPGSTAPSPAAGAPAPANPRPEAAPPPAVQAVPPAASTWAVQLGAFAGRDTASKLVADLRARGYSAFILELRRDAKVLYRVRVGPERDRARAEAIAERLNREGYKATVAAHP